MNIQVVRPTDKNNPVVIACGSGANFQWGDCGCSGEEPGDKDKK